MHQLSYGGSVGAVAIGSSEQPQSGANSYASELKVHHTIFTVTTAGMSEVIRLIFATRLSEHVADVEVKPTLIFLPLIELLILLQSYIQLSNQFVIQFPLFFAHHIISKEDCGLIVLLTAEHVDHTFLRQSAIVGRICLFGRLTLNVVSFAVVVYTKVGGVLNTIRLIFILQVILFQQIFYLLFVIGIVLRIAGIFQIQALNEELLS